MKILKASRFMDSQTGRHNGIKIHRLNSRALLVAGEKDGELLGLISSDKYDLNSKVIMVLIDELYCLLGRENMKNPESELTEEDRKEIVRQEQQVYRKQHHGQ